MSVQPDFPPRDDEATPTTEPTDTTTLPVEVTPYDEHNQALLEAVHPQDRINPEPLDRYHLVVVGAGTAGLVTAAIAAGLGAKVALVERHLMGGDCLNVGCVPSKAIIRAARAWSEARQAEREFGGPSVSGEGDFGKVMERMRALRAGIAPHDSVERYSELGVHVFLGEGRFTGRDTLEVDGRTLRFRRAVVATGARAAAPPIPGLEEAGYLTNESIFSLTEPPDTLVSIGAGPIGLEMAQSFARFGSKVHVLDRSEKIMGREDRDAAAVVHRAMEADGVTFHLGASIERVEERGGKKIVVATVDGEKREIEGDALLVAAGRKPNVDGLGLDVAGVDVGRRGIDVDDRMRTSNKRIFAIGDVASRYLFTHAADAQARMVVANALFFGRRKATSLVMPWTTYTSPEVAHTGYYENDAQEAGFPVETLTLSLAEIDRARLDGDTEGFLRVHLKKGSDRILGATIVAEHAGEMISEFTQAIVNGVGLKKLGDAIRPYPTQSEVVRRAADTLRRRALTPRAKSLFSLFFRVFR
jgi:pyruvate/2-oxoglutarate dehydrogenase complex dihydrolipoamide dehydrogenase (E3) component